MGPSLHNRGQLPLNLKGVETPNAEIVRALSRLAPQPVFSRADRNPAVAFATKADPSGTKDKQNSLVRLVISPTFSVGDTGWDFVTSSGADVSAWILGLGIINIFMKHNTEPGLVYRFTWAGSGISSEPSERRFCCSTADGFPSIGTRMVKFNPFLGKNPPIGANDLDLLPTTILFAGGSFGPAGAHLMAVFGVRLVHPFPWLDILT